MSALLKTCLRAVAADAGGLDQHVPGLAAVGAGIHPQRAADGAGNAEEEFHAADIGRRRRLRHALVERGGAGTDDIALGAGFAEGARRQPDHDAWHAAVAHDQIGADADDVDRQLLRQMLQEVSEIVLIRRREQHLRRTADAKPGQLRQRLVRQQPPAQLRHRGFEIGRDVGESHGLPQRLQFAGQRVGPLRDVAGAEADDEIAAAGDAVDHAWRVRRHSAAGSLRDGRARAGRARNDRGRCPRSAPRRPDRLPRPRRRRHR